MSKYRALMNQKVLLPIDPDKQHTVGSLEIKKEAASWYFKSTAGYRGGATVLSFCSREDVLEVIDQVADLRDAGVRAVKERVALGLDPAGVSVAVDSAVQVLPFEGILE